MDTPDGLQVKLDDIWFLMRNDHGIFERPLLTWLKQDLVRVCEDQALPFVSDPTNTDVTTRRGSLRAADLPRSKAASPPHEGSPSQISAMVAHALGHAWVRLDGVSVAELMGFGSPRAGWTNIGGSGGFSGIPCSMVRVERVSISSPV